MPTGMQFRCLFRSYNEIATGEEIVGSRERDQMSFRERPLKGYPSLRDSFDSTYQIRQPTNVLMTSGGGPAGRSGGRNVFLRNSSSPFVSDKESSSVKQSDHCSLLREVLPKLRPFQREAYDFAIGEKSSSKSNNKPRNLGKILLADEMGLGKTVTSLAIMAKYRDEWPLLILCPASLRHIWPNEIEKWFPSLPSDHIYVVSGFDDADFYDNPSKRKRIEIVVATYSLLQTRSAAAKVLERFQFSCIIADESHNLKQKNSQRTKLVMPLLANAKRLVLLSGTPALARPVELWTQLYSLDPELFLSYTQYTKRYCNARRGRFGWDVNGLSNADELHGKLQQVMIRRLKNDVLHDLPSKQRTIVPIQIVNKETIKKCKTVMEELSSTRKSVSELLTTNPDQATDLHLEERQLLMRAYQMSGVAKASPGVCDYLLEWLRGTTASNKIIVFGHHKAVLDVLEVAVSKEFKGTGHIRIDGSVNSQERASRVRRFQNSGSVRVALLSVTAAGVGLTLTAASTVLFAELHWTPGVLAQAEDRCHRIGQRNAVQVIYCVAQDPAVSIDSQIWSMLGRKVGTLGKVVDGKKGATMDAQLAEKCDSAGEIQEFFAETAPQHAERTKQPAKATIMSFFQVQKQTANSSPSCPHPARSRSTPEPLDSVRWACSTCTYENNQARLFSGLQRCEMCGESYVEPLSDGEGEDERPVTQQCMVRATRVISEQPKDLVGKISIGSSGSQKPFNSNESSVPAAASAIIVIDDDDDDIFAPVPNSASEDSVFRSDVDVECNAARSSKQNMPEVIVVDKQTQSLDDIPTQSSKMDPSIQTKSAVLAFSVSKNSGRISVHDPTTLRPCRVNFEISQVVSSETNDRILEASLLRRSTSKGAVMAVKFDQDAVGRVIGSVASSGIVAGPRSQMTEELEEFVVNYLRLREIEKQVLKESGKPFVSFQLRKAVLVIMTDSAGDFERRTTERYGGGAKERARENIERGVATQEDMEILAGELCAWCGGPMPVDSKHKGVKSTYCSQECADPGRLKRGGMYASSQVRAQLFAREGGKCTKCGIDAGALFARICTLHPAERLNALCNANWKLPKTPRALERLLQNPNEGMFWQADHIVAVSEGGGSCGLENLRTLCVPCHTDETEKLKSRLRLAGGAKGQTEPGKKRQADIRSMFPVRTGAPPLNQAGRNKRPKM